MASEERSNLKEARGQLERALHIYRNNIIEKELAFLTVVKAYEVLIEYCWKELKRRVEEEGLEAQSPKEAVRQGAKIGLLEEPEFWIKAISARNSSVHDYFGISEEAYIKLADRLLTASQAIL